jgi:hypothetical protein
MSTYYFHHIPPSTSFPYILPLPTDTKPQTGPVLVSCPLFFKRYLYRVILLKMVYKGLKAKQELRLQMARGDGKFQNSHQKEMTTWI